MFHVPYQPMFFAIFTAISSGFSNHHQYFGTLQGTNISPLKVAGEMISLFPRRVPTKQPPKSESLSEGQTNSIRKLGRIDPCRRQTLFVEISEDQMCPVWSYSDTRCWKRKKQGS